MKMNMATRKINNRWHIDFRWQGKRIRKVSPENTKGSAIVYERKLMDELVEAKTEKHFSDYKNYEDFVLDWLKIYVTANNRPSEQFKKQGIVKNHLVPYFGKLKLADIGEKEIEMFKCDKIKTKLSPKTIKNILSVLRKSLDSAVQWNCLSHVPHFNWIKVPKKEITVISKECEETLLNNESNTLCGSMVVLALKTGMRLGEMLALRWEDVDFVNNLINVNGSINVEHKRASTKNGRYRVIPMSYSVRTRLEDIYANNKSEYIFDRGDGKPYSIYTASRMLKKLLNDLEIEEHVHWHKLRHTFATNVAKSGVSMRILQELLGHSTIMMTEKYSHVDMESKQSAIQLLDYKNESFGQILGRLPNTQVNLKAKHNRELAVLSNKVIDSEENYLCTPRDSNP